MLLAGLSAVLMYAPLVTSGGLSLCCVSDCVDRLPPRGRFSAHLHQWGHLLELVER